LRDARVALRESCEDPLVTVLLEHGGRRFQAMAYHDAVRHDGPALELAELVDGELGPALVTVLFADGAGEDEVLLTDGALPLPILTAFLRHTAPGDRPAG
jgi:hypothetical protein